MPIINIHGSGGRGPTGGGPPNSRQPSMTGPSSTVPWMRPNYDQAFNSQPPPGPQGASDYDRAQRQREAQERRAAAAERQRQAQMDAAYRQAQQRAVQARHDAQRDMREEVRQYEAAQRAKAKADADLQRQRERDARAQDQLDRRKSAVRERDLRFQRSQDYGNARAIDSARDRGFRFQRSQEYGDARAIDAARTRRLREETMLGRQFEALQYRAGRPLNATTYATLQRQAGLLGARAADFQSRYGQAPAGLSGLGGVVSGMGSLGNAYATQNILSLGGRGQRAAEGREWVGLARIEQELRRIERVNQAILTDNRKATAEQKINAQRNLATAASARARIGAGRSGTSPLMNMAGSAIGNAGMLLANPYVDLAVGAAVGLTMSPFLIAGTTSRIMGMSQQYNNLRKGTAALGRAGGFNSRDLQDRLFPGGAAPGWMKQLGVTTQSGLGILNDYGISTRSPEEAMQLIADTRRASLSPFMGLGDSQLAGSARLARTLGIASPDRVLNSGSSYAVQSDGKLVPTQGQTETNAYFNKLQQVMAAATAQGLDHASTLKTVEGLLRITAGAGATSVNAGALTNFWGRMSSSGLPSMRTGEGVASALEGINQSFSSIGVGGKPAQNVMMMSYFGRHGGMPKTEAALQKFLGMSGDDWAKMMSNPAQRKMVDNYLNAADKNPAFALSYLSPMLQGRPDLMQHIFEGSAFGNTNSLIKPLIGGAVTGAGYPGYTAMTTGHDLGPVPGGTAPIPGTDVDAAIRAAANGTGIDVNLLRGLAAKESGMNPGVANGNAAGLFQLMPGARGEVGLSDADKFDPQKNAVAGATYLKKMFGLFDKSDPDRSLHALEAYEWGPGHAAEISAGQVPDVYRQHAETALRYGAQYANTPASQFASEANTEAAGLTASKDAWRNAGRIIGEAPGDAMVNFSDTVVTATGAMENWIRALVDGTQAIKYGAMGNRTPGGFSAMDPTGAPYLLPSTGPGQPFPLHGPARP